MNKNEFINQLSVCLRYMPKEDRDDAISYYTEYLGDMELSDTEDVTMKLGNPKDVAQEILNDYTVKVVEAQKERGGVKNSGKVIWMVILTILSLPVSLPLAVAALAVVLVLTITIFCVLLVFFAVGLCLVVAGVLTFIFSFTTGSVGNILMAIGVALAVTGIGVLLTIGVIALFKLLIKAIGALAVKGRQKQAR